MIEFFFLLSESRSFYLPTKIIVFLFNGVTNEFHYWHNEIVGTKKIKYQPIVCIDIHSGKMPFNPNTFEEKVR